MIKTYLRIIIVKNIMNYLLIVLSIIVSYIIIAVLLIYIENAIILSSAYIHPKFSYLYTNIRTVFILAGVTLIISQYYNIMKSSLGDYILKSIDATKSNIRMLILIQVSFLIFISIPIGLFSGYLLTTLILNKLGSFSLNSNMREIISSTDTFYMVAGAVFCFIISIGIYVDSSFRNSLPKH